MKLIIFLVAAAVVTGCLLISCSFSSKHTVKSIEVALGKETTQQPLHITGSIPEWLHGTFVRNGPVSVKINGEKIAHWFDGPAMLHAFKFEAGKVLYTNKFLKSDVYESVFIQKNIHYAGFATQSDTPWWNKIKSFISFNAKQSIQNANVNVAKIANEYVALTETPLPVRFDIKTMDTLGVLKFQDDLPMNNIFESAHIQDDQNAQEKINYLVKYGKESEYVIYRLNPEIPRREVIGKIQVKNPSYMHSFAITKNYIILVEFPFTVNPIDLLLMKKPFIKNFAWHPERGTNFLIIDRKTGQLIKAIKCNNAFFAFHHVNAYEENDKIILDVITYPDAQIISNIAAHSDSNVEDIDRIENQTLSQTKLMRYILSVTNAAVQPVTILDIPIEFPRINEHYNAKSYRYVYAVDPRPLDQVTDLRPLYKIDLITREKMLWQEPGLIPGEPVFIPSPRAVVEDDGVVVSILLNEDKQVAFLLILDAKNFKEIGRIYAPYPIPTGLHGQFFIAS